MAKLTMSKVTIVGHKSSRKGVLETLQRRGAMEIETASLPEGYSLPDTSGQIQFFDSSAAEGRQALEILNGVAPIKQSVLASFKGRRELSVDAFHERLADIKKTNAAVGDINALKKQMNDCAAEVARLTLQLAETEPWLSLDIPMAHRGTKDMAVFTGALPYSADEQEILTRLAQTAPEVNLFDLEIVSQGREQTCIAAFCHRAQVAEFETALRGIGFTVPTHLSMRTARLRAKSLNERKMALEMEIPLLESLIKTLAPHREDIELLVDYYSMRSDKYEKISRLAVGKNVFAISGYIPAKYAPAILNELEEKYPVAAEMSEAGEDAPVCLENKAFFSPVASVTAMYSMPAKDDVDPSPIMAVFFYLSFGIMFSDAGYGLLMTIATGIMLLKVKMEKAKRENIKMFFFCGISTTIWGLVFGGFFGNMISVIAETFFNSTFTMPALIVPDQDPITFLVFSIVVGMLQVFVGMGIKFYMLCRQGHPLDAVLDVGLWYVFILGLVMLLAGGVIGIPLVGTIGQWAAIAGGVLIFLTAGRKSKGIGGKIIGGLAFGGLYDISSYLSDMLSYSRLMALGLATGIIAGVMNLLGSLFGGGIVGIIAFVIIFIIGHAVNFAINALGAYVHTIRLQYVEFFSKFYEGGGRKFQPFHVDTKYIRFKEEKNDVRNL